MKHLANLGNDLEIHSWQRDASSLAAGEAGELEQGLRLGVDLEVLVVLRPQLAVPGVVRVVLVRGFVRVSVRVVPGQKNRDSAPESQPSPLFTGLLSLPTSESKLE